MINRFPLISLLSLALLSGQACSKKSSSKKPATGPVQAIPADIKEQSAALKDRAEKSMEAIFPELQKSYDQLKKSKAWEKGLDRLADQIRHPGVSSDVMEVVLPLIFHEDYAHGVYNGYVLYDLDGVKEAACEDISCEKLMDSYRVGAQLLADDGIKVTLFDSDHATVLGLELASHSVNFDLTLDQLSTLLGLLRTVEGEEADASMKLQASGRITGKFAFAEDKASLSIVFPEPPTFSSVEIIDGDRAKTDITLGAANPVFSLEQDFSKGTSDLLFEIRSFEVKAVGGELNLKGFSGSVSTDERRVASKLTLFGGVSTGSIKDPDSAQVRDIALHIDKDWVIKHYQDNSDKADLRLSTVDAKVVSNAQVMASLVVDSELDGLIKENTLKIKKGHLQVDVRNEKFFSLDFGACYTLESEHDFDAAMNDQRSSLPVASSCPASF